MQKPAYDYALVLALRKRCTGANVHTIGTLLSQYENLYTIAEDAGEVTYINGKPFNIYSHMLEVHALMEKNLKTLLTLPL